MNTGNLVALVNVGFFIAQAGFIGSILCCFVQYEKNTDELYSGTPPNLSTV